MPHDDSRSVGSFEDAVERDCVIRERGEGKRCARHFKPRVSQWQNHVLPAGTIRPCAMHQHDRTHQAAPFAARNSFISAAISTTCVSVAKWPVSRKSIRALGMSLRNASAPAGKKNGSFLPQIASNGGRAFRK